MTDWLMPFVTIILSFIGGWVFSKAWYRQSFVSEAERFAWSVADLIDIGEDLAKYANEHSYGTEISQLIHEWDETCQETMEVIGLKREFFETNFEEEEDE